MVGVAAAVAVAGSANAGVVDPFTTAEPFSTNSGNWLPISGALFNERDAVRTNGSSGSIDNLGNLIFTAASGFNFLGLNYQMSGGATKDLSSIAEISIVLSDLVLNCLELEPAKRKYMTYVLKQLESMAPVAAAK
jgi:hypothetical protein